MGIGIIRIGILPYPGSTAALVFSLCALTSKGRGRGRAYFTTQDHPRGWVGLGVVELIGLVAAAINVFLSIQYKDRHIGLVKKG